MPALAEQFNLGVTSLTGSSRVAEWEKSIKKAIRKMDEDEFNLFLAQVVIKASSKLIMGVDLTAQVQALRELRA